MQLPFNLLIGLTLFGVDNALPQPIQKPVRAVDTSTDTDVTALDSELTKKWLPVDCYIGGNEHAVLHLMYARFLTMALNDLGVIDFAEPFKKFRAHGILNREGRKMSKSKGNVIVPDDIIAEFGADTMRLYLLFLGPFEQGGDYQGKGIHGPYGFRHRQRDRRVSSLSPGASSDLWV